jgi:ABC-type nitrate/sulfonate/bicarbonate transport system substrate-binding protein
LSPAPNSATQLASLVEGRIDIAMTAMDNVVAHEDGDLFAFLGVNNGGRFNLMVAPSVKSYADLKGRPLAVDALATGYAFVLMAMLQRGGLAVGDYELVSVGGSRERLAALRSGNVAGALLSAPQDAAAEAAGFLRLANSEEAVGRYQGSVGAARRSWAAANGDTLVRYIRAYVAAVDWLYEPPNRAEAIDLLQRRLANVTPEAAARSHDELLHPAHGSLSRKAAIDVEGVRTVLRLRGEFARPPKALRDPSRYYDLSYYERALRND